MWHDWYLDEEVIEEGGCVMYRMREDGAWMEREWHEWTVYFRREVVKLPPGIS